MSIRPIDYQIVLNKAGDLSKDANFIRSKPNIEQFQFSEELQKKKIQDEKKVISTTKTEHRRIDKKAQRDTSQSRSYNNNREQDSASKPTEDKEKLLTSGKNSKIDIKI